MSSSTEQGVTTDCCQLQTPDIADSVMPCRHMAVLQLLAKSNTVTIAYTHIVAQHKDAHQRSAIEAV
jgi:hypothetical protein